MPYIKDKSTRDYLDAVVDDLICLFKKVDMTGNLNYLLFKLCKEYIKLEGENYAHYRDYVGELECAKSEILRRLIAPYEDKAKERNGDVK
ncbi:MAG: hypothetical protein R6U65_02750 [Perlabentimonas sp.]